MKMSLLKKYFRLAVRLLRFKQCKTFLNSSPPSDDNYFLLIQQIAMEDRRRKYKHMQIEKERAKIEEYMKLVSDKSSCDSSVIESCLEEEKRMTNKLLVERKSKTHYVTSTSALQKILNIVKGSSNAVSKLDIVKELPEDNIPCERDSRQSPKHSVGQKQLREKFQKSLMKKTAFEPIKSPRILDVLRKEESESNVLLNQSSFVEPKPPEHLNKKNKKLTLIDENPNASNAKEESILLKTEIKFKDPEVIEVENDGNHIMGVLNHLKSSRRNAIDVGLHKGNTSNKDYPEVLPDLEANNSKIFNLDEFLNKKKTSKDFLDGEQFIINVQIILIDNLIKGEQAFYCLCLLSSIPNRYINSEYSE